MRNALVSILALVIRPLTFALVLTSGPLSLAPPAEAGGWHGGWHGGGCCWGGSSVSLSFGFPGYYAGPFFGFPGYYPYTAYAYYPAYPYPTYTYAQPYYPPAPPVSVVQRALPPGPAPVQYWYYCDNPRGYYPYVQSCGAGWRPVPAQPAGVQTP